MLTSTTFNQWLCDRAVNTCVVSQVKQRPFAETKDYGTAANMYNVSIHTVKWIMIKKHTPEVNTLSETSISSVNASLPWKWCTGHDSRENAVETAHFKFC